MRLVAAALAALAAAPASALQEPPAAAPAPAPPPSLAPSAPAPEPVPSPPRSRQRDPWYIGFGLGVGGGSYSTSGGRRSFADHVRPADPLPLSLNFKVGGTVSPSLLVGLDVTAAASSGTHTVAGGSYFRTAQVTNYDGMVTWFPWETGLHLRAGAGLATLVLVAEEPGAAATRQVRTGVGAVLGGGYAFWLGESFNMTLTLDLSAQAYGDDLDRPRNSSAVAFFVGFDWY